MATSALEAELEELQKRKREVDAALREERKSSKRSSRAATKAAKSLPSMILELDADNMAFDVVVPPALATHKDKETVLTLYDLSGHCADVVASWLLGQGRSKDSEQVQYDAALRQRATAGVEWLFIKSPVEALGSWLDGAPNHSFSLGRYVVEYRLFHWIVDQNCAKGVAPQYKQLRDHAANIVPEALPAPEKAKLVNFFLANTRASRHWLVSFRQRWGVKPGALVAGQALEPEDLQTRAPWKALSYSFCVFCN